MLSTSLALDFTSMITHADLDLNEIARLGKDFKWPRPVECPKCHEPKVWGHGFVSAIFVAFTAGLYLKRWRCPACRLILTVRPSGYFSRYQSPTKLIHETLGYRFICHHWPPKIPRQRALHWLNRFLLFLRLQYGESQGDDAEPYHRLDQLFSASVKFLATLP